MQSCRMLLAFLFLLAGLCVSAAADGPKDLVWICMFYHKTGTEFCQKMFERLSDECDLEYGRDAKKSREKDNAFEYYHDAKNHKLVTSSHFISMRPSALSGPWSKVFDNPNLVYRSILMVRDPFSLIMSSYKYHSQLVPPEEWLKRADRQFCPLHKHLEKFEPIARVKGSMKKLVEVYNKLESTCRVLHSIFGKGSSYHKSLLSMGKLNQTTVNQYANTTAANAYLQSMPSYTHDAAKYGPDLYPAIRMEAFRSIREIEDMTITKLYEDPAMSMSMSMEEFGVGNLTQFTIAAKKMTDFIMSNAPQDCSLCKCLKSDKIVSHIVKASYISPSSVISPPPSSSSSKSAPVTHVTAGLMSKEAQLLYIERLKTDPVLGDYLNMLAGVISKPTPKTKTLLIDKYPNVTA